MRLLGAVAAVVAMTTAASGEPLPLEVAIHIGPDVRETIVFEDGDHLWMPVALLCDHGLCPPAGMVRDDIAYVDLANQRASLRYKLDADAGTLAVAIHTDALPETTIHLANLAPAGMEAVGSPSLFVNYAATAGYGPEASAMGFAEAGFAVDHLLAYTAVTAADPGSVIRGLSNITIDRPETLRRYTVGDDVVVGGLLGGGGVLGGVHLARDFSLDPYFVIQPTLSQTGVVNAPAVVEVYRDGQLIRKEVIPAGPFRIQDLASTQAADTQVIVRDPFGATQQVMTTTLLPPAAALKPGLAQYDYSIGFARTQLATASFSYGSPAALFVHRLGVSNALTIGGRVEATLDRASGGASALFAFGRASAELTGAASVTEVGPSAALALDVGWRLPRGTIAILARVVGRHYATIDLGPEDDRATAETGALVGWSPLADLSLSAQGSYEHHSDGDDRIRGSFAVGYAFGSLRASASAGVGFGDTTGRELDATLAVSGSLGDRTSASVGVTHDASGSAAIASVSHAVSQNRGVGYDVDVRAGQSASGHGLVDVEHAAGRVEASVDYFAGSPRASATVAGGLVAIGGRVLPTRPVESAFALVRVPGAGSVHVLLDNHPVGSTDSDGDLVVPDLAAFYANRLSIDVRDVPMSIATTTLDRLIAPPRRGGAVVEFAPPHSATVIGTASAAGRDLSFADLVLDGGAPLPVGHEGRFELETVASGSHRATIEVDGQRCSFAFVVPARSRLVDLHEVECR